MRNYWSRTNSLLLVIITIIHLRCLLWIHIISLLFYFFIFTLPYIYENSR
nr:MAG TPA: hypothetical protein [Caudoviricetes sp.]